MMTNASSVKNWDIWHTTVPTWNVLIVMNMAMPQQITQTKSHHQVHLQGTEIPLPMQDAVIDLRLTMMIIETDIDLTSRDSIPAVIDTGVTVRSNSWRSHSRSYHRCTHRSTSCHRNSSAYHHPWDTPHRISSSHRSFSTHSRDCSRSRPCTSHKNSCITSCKLSYSSNRTAWKNKDRKYKWVTIDDPPSKYYSSDEPSSESDEDLN